MKKLLTIISIAALGFTAQAQTTTILKQELDTTVINKLYSCYAIDQESGKAIVAKNEKQKKEFVNDMVLKFLKHISKDCAGSSAADKARKNAEDAIELKPINKVD